MNSLHNTLVSRIQAKVIGVTHLTQNAFILRMERNGMEFRAGQYVTIGFPGQVTRREYSIYSGEQDDFLEILALGVPEGSFSRQLQQIKPGASLMVEGPFGYFTLSENDPAKETFVFIATGTGISPFHSFVRTCPGLDYRLLHGIPTINDAYMAQDYDAERYTACTSRDRSGKFYGRVTDYLKQHDPVPQAGYYFCGNSRMIHDAMDILTEKGIDPAQFQAEVYY
ncbi:MAG TPA: oxidoreductase [Bacteroidetes bacterium]|nr:oxidoreductase [Bacteroidota bacterium]